MSDLPDAGSDALDDEFERLGRRAGAELRTPPPPDGHQSVERTTHRRRATIATIATGATVALIVAGLVIARREPQPRQDDGPAPVTTPTSTAESSTSTVETDTSTVEPAGDPGSFRVLRDSPLAPTFPVSATWTGSRAIVLGSDDLENTKLSALSYDVGSDRWTRLADPPAALTGESFPWPGQLTSWTGSEVLVWTNQGILFAYDPVADVWTALRSPDESTGLDEPDSVAAVSPRGVLARSSLGWWWYDNPTDRWTALPSPEHGVDYSMIDVLNGDAMVATRILSSSITSSVFDIDTRTWRNGPPVESFSTRDDLPRCDAADGLVVCFTEGYGRLTGAVIEPLVGTVGSFTLGNHDNSMNISGIPWITHAWKLLIPRSATWEDLPSLGGVDGFDVAVWTGSEIVFFGASDAGPGERLGTMAAYTPVRLPGT